MLLNSIAELKAIVGGVMLEWSEDTIQPFVQDAEARYIIPAIGQKMFDVLVAEYASPTGPGTPLSILLVKIQKAVGRYTLFEAAPQMNVSVGDYGIHQHTTQHSNSADTWKYYEYKEKLAESGDLDLDEALRYMEAQPSGTYPWWEFAPEYLLSKELFINNTEAFSNHIPIRNSRRAWLALREYVKEAEIIYAVPNISLALFNDLKAKILGNNITQAEDQFLKYLKRSLANYAVYKALPKTPVSITSDGIRVSSYQDYYRIKLKAGHNDLTALKSDSHESGEQWMNIALEYLKANASPTEFAVWYNAQQAAITASTAATNNGCCNHNGSTNSGDASGIFMF